MTKRNKLIIYGLFVLVYLSFIFINYKNGTNWFIIDNIIGIIFLTFLLLISKWFKIESLEMFLAGLAMLVHNLGTFGFYEFTWKTFAYDNLVHLVSTSAAAYIIFNFIARKIHIKKEQRVKKTFIDEHKIIFLFLVISSVAMLGVLVELIEFGGFINLGSDNPRGGFLNVDAEGDFAAKEYYDTMGDILSNLIGSIIGTVIYYNFQYKRKPWLKY